MLAIESSFSKIVIKCRDFYVQNRALAPETICSSSVFILLQNELKRNFQILSELVAEKYDGWQADADHPGYLFKRSDSSVVRFPYYLVPVAPNSEKLEKIWRISRSVKTTDDSTICLSGSTVSLSAVPNFSDIDFCEYIDVGDNGENHNPVRNGISENTVDRDGRFFRELKLGRKKYNRKNRNDIVQDQETISPLVYDHSWGKIDYILEEVSELSAERLRICDVTNFMIFYGPTAGSKGKEKTFAHQEALLDASVNIPNDLTDPFQIGRYVYWLIEETENHLGNGNLVKACKRALALSRVGHLGKFSNQISEIALWTSGFIDAELEAISELIAELDPNDRSGKRSLQRSKKLLELEKTRIEVLTDGELQNFEAKASKVLGELLSHLGRRPKMPSEEIAG